MKKNSKQVKFFIFKIFKIRFTKFNKGYEKIDCSNSNYQIECEYNCIDCSITFELKNFNEDKIEKTEIWSHDSLAFFDFSTIINTCSSYQIFAFLSKIGFKDSEKQLIKNFTGYNF